MMNEKNILNDCIIAYQYSYVECIIVYEQFKSQVFQITKPLSDLCFCLCLKYYLFSFEIKLFTRRELNLIIR